MRSTTLPPLHWQVSVALTPHICCQFFSFSLSALEGWPLHTTPVGLSRPLAPTQVLQARRISRRKIQGQEERQVGSGYSPCSFSTLQRWLGPCKVPLPTPAPPRHPLQHPLPLPCVPLDLGLLSQAVNSWVPPHSLLVSFSSLLCFWNESLYWIRFS